MKKILSIIFTLFLTLSLIFSISATHIGHSSSSYSSSKYYTYSNYEYKNAPYYKSIGTNRYYTSDVSSSYISSSPRYINTGSTTVIKSRTTPTYYKYNSYYGDYYYYPYLRNSYEYRNEYRKSRTNPEKTQNYYLYNKHRDNPKHHY